MFNIPRLSVKANIQKRNPLCKKYITFIKYILQVHIITSNEVNVYLRIFTSHLTASVTCVTLPFVGVEPTPGCQKEHNLWATVDLIRNACRFLYNIRNSTVKHFPIGRFYLDNERLIH